jgi:hypothetical protein
MNILVRQATCLDVAVFQCGSNNDRSALATCGSKAANRDFLFDFAGVMLDIVRVCGE